MNRLWSILFCFVPLAAVAAYVAAAQNAFPLSGLWLPENISRQGQTIDYLFLLIHYLAAAILLLTGLILAWVMWRFRDRPGARARYITHHRRLEAAWTIIPAAILIWLSLHQLDAWAENKIRRPVSTSGNGQAKPPLARVVAKQFGWEVYYPGKDGRFNTPDDVYFENQLFAPVDQDVVLELRSRDVIHSFFVPELRLKQDIVPGSTQYLWFRILPHAEARRFDIVCAELCGAGHYRMNGSLYPVSAEEFRRSIEQRAADRWADSNP
jgi:cytochrome c oxidase subunit 2